MSIQKIVILGSTGSIGINTLNVVRRFPDKFKVVGLTAYNNIELFENQIKEFKPKFAAIGENHFASLKKLVSGTGVKILNVESDLEYLVSMNEIDCVVIAMKGAAALKPFLKAVKCGKRVAPANKEALVIAGHLIMSEAKRNKAEIIPVDSEQSAIFQCLEGQNRKQLQKILLTASGGPLLRVSQEKFEKLTVQQILKHPCWKMGQKITVDSATLMNKGFEVLEAKHLFDLKMNEIEVVIHPEAIIHSMVEFIDGSVMAQLAVTDMQIPIQYALTYPQRWPSGLAAINFKKLKALHFEEPNYEKFPALSLALYVAQKEGTLPAVLNAVDEEAVEAFLNKKIGFLDIYRIVEKVVTKHSVIPNPNLSAILDADRWAREEAKILLQKI